MAIAPTARYLEIAHHLRALVAAARPGDRLPSDAELCERFGVSRMTARQAVGLLTNENLLYRRRGEGTFVAPRTVPRLLGSPLSFSESMRRRGLATTSEVLDAGWTVATGDEARALALRDGDQVVVVERLRLVNDIPMAIERAVLPRSCAGVLRQDLAAGSLHAAFERLGRIPSRAAARVRARTATARERRLLGLGRSGVVLVERRTIWDQHDVPIEHTESGYAAERYEFEAVLARDELDRVY